MALTYPMAQDHRVAAGSAAVVRPYPDDVSTWPGGSMFSSARELARFALALIDGGRIDGRQVFPGAAIEKLRTRQADAPGGCGYTYGLADCTTRGVRTLSHYGFRSGSGSIVSIAPAERAAIILLANRAGGILSRSEAEARRMLFGLAPAPSGGDPSGPKAAPMGPAALARLAGDYVNGSDVLTLRAAGGALTYRYRDGDEQPIKAIGPREIAVTSAAGDPVQPFLVLQGRVTGDTYLSDGLTAFRRRAAKP
jgi:CubicO group peptidase (beta-lactamase class C family)